MSEKLTRRGRLCRWALAVTAAGITGASGFAQTPTGGIDAIERAKAYARILDQKAEADVRAAMAEAEKIATIDRTRAIRRLRETISGLDLSPQVSSEKRVELVAILQARMDAIQGKAAPAAQPDPKLAKHRAEADALVQAYSKEAKEVNETIGEIEKLLDIGRITAARSRIATLAQKYPTNPSVIALTTSQADFGSRVIEAKQLAKESEGRVLYAMNEVQRSALPAKGNVEFPENWKELTEARKEKSLIGPEEEAILRALEKPVKQGLNNSPFLETVQTLSNLIGKEIYLDKRSLEDAGLDLQRAVNMPANVTARTALRTVLQAQGLTFVVKDKIIQVVTVEKARDLQITRAYYLGDLVQLSGPFAGAITWGPQIDYQQTMANAQIIVDSIKQSIDPLVWKERGGPGIVVFHYPTKSLIVRAPSEVHADLAGRRYAK